MRKIKGAALLSAETDTLHSQRIAYYPILLQCCRQAERQAMMGQTDREKVISYLKCPTD